MERRHRFAALAFAVLPALVHAQLTGTYSVGAGSPDYSTLADAVNDLLNQGADGDVTFEIRSGTYTGKYELGGIPGSPGNITFKSQTNVAADVVLEWSSTSVSDNYIFRLDDADNVSFEALTFHPLNNDRARAVHFFNDADGLQVRDCVFIGSTSPSLGSYWDRILLHCDQNDIGTPDNPDFVVVRGCEFRHGSEAVELSFEGLGGVRSEGLLIVDNVFLGQVGTGVVINNAVGRFSGNFMHTDVGNGFVGLRTSYLMSGMQVVDNVLQLKSTVFGCTGMELGNTQFTTDNLIGNNMITVDGPGENWGLAVYNLWGTTILNNSVVVRNGQPGTSRAFYHLGNFSDGQDAVVRNNLFINYSGGPAARWNVDGNIALEDHNDLFTTGAVLTQVAGADHATLADHQAATGLGQADVSIDPAFPFLPDLHVNSCDLEDLGQLDPLLITDVDGELRGDPACDMGADEYTHTGQVSISINVPYTELPFTLTAGNGVEYLWNTGATTQSIDVPEGGFYTCLFTDALGCSYVIEYEVTSDLSTAVPVQPATMEQLVLQPNPARDLFDIPGDRTGWERVQLFGADGRCLRQWAANARFELGGLAAGAYVVRLVRTDGVNPVARLVVE